MKTIEKTKNPILDVSKEFEDFLDKNKKFERGDQGFGPNDDGEGFTRDITFRYKGVPFHISISNWSD